MVTSVTYGGSNMSLVGTREVNDNGDDGRVYIYSLVAPNVGTANVQANFSANLLAASSNFIEVSPKVVI